MTKKVEAADYISAISPTRRLADVARELNVTTAAVSFFAKKANLPFKKLTLNQVRNCAVSGLSIKETAARLGHRYEAVYQFARRHGIPFQREKRSKKLPPPPPWLRPLPTEVYSWLLSEAPAGSTLSEFACSILLDAYHHDIDLANSTGQVSQAVSHQ